jgi:hypothetical protein
MNSIPPIYILDSAIQSLKAIQHIPAYVSLREVAKIICFVACLANLYFLFRHQAKFLLILSRFEEIHKFFRLSSVQLQKPRRQVQLIIYAICILAWAINVLKLAILPQKHSLSSLISKVIYIIVATALQSLGTQFLSFSILIIFYLKHINLKIAELQKICCTSNEILSKQIDDLRAAHIKLCDNSRLINQVYGIYLVLPLSYISIHLQMDMFEMIRKLLDYMTEFSYDSLGGAWWLITIMWIINDMNKLSTYFIVSYLVRIEVN